jgi:non-ribosomal peptide synthetase component F
MQPSRRGATVGFTVGEGLLQELRRVSQGEGATLFMTLVAAFQVLLHYYSGQSDIVVGTDDANRQRGETEGLIGFFINQLALRTDLSGNPSFRKVLQRVRQTTLDAYVHNAAPFEKVVEALNIQRSLQHSPVFQVQITMQNVVGEGVTVHGLSVEPYGALLPSSKFDLTLFLTEEAQQLRCAFNYSTELFTLETITKYRKDFLQILEAASVNPDLTIQDLASRTGIAAQPGAYTPAGLRAIRPAPIVLP